MFGSLTSLLRISGGWYVMERTTTYIKVWFWPRNSLDVPASVRNGAGSVETSGFGKPSALFTNGSCNLASHMGPHNIIINLTFCKYLFLSFTTLNAHTGILQVATGQVRRVFTATLNAQGRASVSTTLALLQIDEVLMRTLPRRLCEQQPCFVQERLL